MLLLNIENVCFHHSTVMQNVMLTTVSVVAALFFYTESNIEH